jgi:poly(3-hydroxybutyrate) depolymerase
MSPFPLALLLIMLLWSPLMAQERLVLQHDGKVRTVLIDAAPNVRNAPLMIALHGGIGGPQFIRRRAAVTLPRRGWVLVDPNRVFVGGISLGGTMALRVVCEAPDLVRGAAVALAALPVGLDCPPYGAVPLLLLHGTSDSIMPPRGGRIGGGSFFIRDRGRVRSITETETFLAWRNGCTGYRDVGSSRRNRRYRSHMIVRVYTGCTAPLVHYIVPRSGHDWPGASATAAVERFFEGLLAAQCGAAERAAPPRRGGFSDCDGC